MENVKKIVEELRRRGLSNGASSGYHCGLMDEAAEVIERQQIQIEGLQTKLKTVKVKAKKEFAENKFSPCDGCKHIGLRYPFASMYPCNNCVRANQKDYYELKELVGER